jgi:NitT/TauT family transport system substrate-binding protein
VQWVADIIRRGGLDAARGFRLETKTLANTDAARIAIMGGAADIVTSDWPFVAVQRASGTRLCFAPFSSATGGIMVPHDSAVRSLGDLRGRRLGVAGGPTDKSWLVVRAAARRSGLDLTTDASIVYGAPPLLGAKLGQGELDAVLTFWTHAARLEAAGFREVVSVDACAAALGLPGPLGLVGFVFREDWATTNRSAIDGFLGAAEAAQTLLATSDDAWTQIRPLMDAPDDALFQTLRRRFTGGIVARQPAAAREQAARQLFAVLRDTGGPGATGGLTDLPDGIFWRAGDQAG